jgi:hypothetical protein
MTEDVDYQHDSLAEITLKQAEVIERQGARILSLLMENMALREDADSVIAGNYERLEESLLLLENWVFWCIEEGEDSCDARALLEVLRDCYEYAESNVVPAWFEAARRVQEASE